MVNFSLIKTGVGFGIKGFGLFWGISNRFLCKLLCFNGSCAAQETGNCSLLFLFVAIIFIIVGYAIVTLPKRKREKVDALVKTDIKKGGK